MKKAIILALLLITILFFSGCFEIKTGQEITNIGPEFDIFPSVVTTTGYNTDTSLDLDLKNFTVPAVCWNVSHNIRTMNNGTWYDPRLQFNVSIVPKPGMTTDIRETIYFRVENYDARITRDGRNYRLITKSGAWHKITWSCDSQRWYVEGSKTMDILEDIVLTLDFDINQVGMAHMGLFDKLIMPIVFTNEDNSWNETFYVCFVIANEIGI